MFRTGIPNIYIVLIEDHGDFLENEKLKIMEFNEDLLFEAEIQGTMNSLELNTDMLYQDINYRLCQAQRQQIITSQALMRKNLEILKDEKGRTLLGHVTGEAAVIHKCGTRLVKPRGGEQKCCREMPIWVGDDFRRLVS